MKALISAHHNSSDVVGVISIQIELEGHHLVVVRLQLTLNHSVYFIRELQRQRRSMVMTGVSLSSKMLSNTKGRMDFVNMSHVNTNAIPL